MSGLSLDQLKVITRAMDVNRNNRLDDNEIDVQSLRALREASRNQQGYANDVIGTSELARALHEDRVTLKRLSAPVADAIANALSGGDAWVSKEDFQFSETVRARIDVNGDNRVSRQELSNALQNGTIEVGSTFRLAGTTHAAPPRPTAPPPSHHHRPAPPPEPNVFDRLREVERLHNMNAMSFSDFSRAKKDLISQEVNFLLADRTVPPRQRLEQLTRLYNAYSFDMGLNTFSDAKKRILGEEVRNILADRARPATERLENLTRLYNDYSFDIGLNAFSEAKKTILKDEIEFLVSDRTTPTSQRLNQLERLYQQYSFDIGLSAYRDAARRISGY